MDMDQFLTSCASPPYFTIFTMIWTGLLKRTANYLGQEEGFLSQLSVAHTPLGVLIFISL